MAVEVEQGHQAIGKEPERQAHIGCTMWIEHFQTAEEIRLFGLLSLLETVYITNDTFKITFLLDPF